MKGENKMGNIAKGLTALETVFTFINAIAKIIGFNEQTWFEIIFPFIGFMVCMTILVEAKRYLKEEEEVEEYFEYY